VLGLATRASPAPRLAHAENPRRDLYSLRPGHGTRRFSVVVVVVPGGNPGDPHDRPTQEKTRLDGRVFFCVLKVSERVADDHQAGGMNVRATCDVDGVATCAPQAPEALPAAQTSTSWSAGMPSSMKRPAPSVGASPSRPRLLMR